MTIAALVDQIIAREGGYVDHPADRGGATRWGITTAVARANGYHGAIRDLPRPVAAAIYETVYWRTPRFDRIALRAPALAAEMFDTGVNMGTAVATGFLQRALNALNRGASDFADLTVDQMVGSHTLAALDAFLIRRGTPGERVLVKAIDALQGERYLSLTERRPANEAFLYGWLAERIA
ncbi:N-acetylmuramidase [Sphingomonadaceae bacterium OTU29LAMAA1]|nr:N-acetylmuramidase [Sphingomonadaceae bacterium OTU29LAMAA1]